VRLWHRNCNRVCAAEVAFRPLAAGHVSLRHDDGYNGQAMLIGGGLVFPTLNLIAFVPEPASRAIHPTILLGSVHDRRFRYPQTQRGTPSFHLAILYQLPYSIIVLKQ